jgi:hypothetical protein
MSDAAMPIATDPLGAIRMELVGAARRRSATRHRRQRISTATAVGLATVATAAGASAVTGVGTGIPAVDELLGNFSSRQVDPPGPRGGIRFGSNAPASRATSPPLKVPGDHGSPTEAVAYVSRGAGICFAFAKPSGEGVSEARGVGGCMSPTVLSQRLADDAFLVIGTSTGRGGGRVNGYASKDVESIEVLGPDGPLAVQLTDAWKPDVAGAEPLRVFVAIGASGAGGEGLHVDEVDRLIDPRNYTVTARLADGRTVESGR